MEEINISGDEFTNHETEVVASYTDCVHAQIEYYKENEKLKRLRTIEAELTGSSTATTSAQLADCRLDRWTVAAQHICKRLLAAKESTTEKLKREQAEGIHLCS